MAAKVEVNCEELDRLSDDIFPTDVTGTFCWSEVKTVWMEALDRFQRSLSELRHDAEKGDPTKRACSGDRQTDGCRQRVGGRIRREAEFVQRCESVTLARPVRNGEVACDG